MDQPVGNDQIFCSHCGTENASDGYSCVRCGERLIAVNTDTPSPTGLVSCARCGGANNNRAVYCWVCGTAMDDAVRMSATSESTPSRVAGKYRPDLNPVPVPTPASEPNDERANVRGPAAGPGPGTGVAPAPSPDGSATAEEPATNTSGTRGAEVPPSIKRWNWAAFLVPDIWGVFNGIPWTLILILLAYSPFPPFGIRVAIVIAARVFLGLRGNQLAWQGKKWRSETHFREVQRRWVNLSVVTVLILMVLIFLTQGTVAGGEQGP